MVYKSSQEILDEIKHIMFLRGISKTELATSMGRSRQAINQIFYAANPKLSTLYEICNALNLKIDIEFVEGDAE